MRTQPVLGSLRTPCLQASRSSVGIVAGPKKPTPPPVFEVLWHPEAVQERDDIEDAGERLAIMAAEEKLKQFGRYLPAPHSRAVEGKEDRGLRDSRPRGSKSR